MLCEMYVSDYCFMQQSDEHTEIPGMKCGVDGKSAQAEAACADILVPPLAISSEVHTATLL